MTTRILTVALALVVASCGSTQSPTQPTPDSTPSPSPAPAPTAPGTTNWTVTQTFVSVEGPDNCWIRSQRQRLTGAVFPNLDTTITRTDGTLRIESQWFQVNYAGTYSGPDFTATGVAPLSAGGTECNGTSFQQMPGVSNVSGRFAENDQS